MSSLLSISVKSEDTVLSLNSQPDSLQSAPFIATAPNASTWVRFPLAQQKGKFLVLSPTSKNVVERAAGYSSLVQPRDFHPWPSTSDKTTNILLTARIHKLSSKYISVSQSNNINTLICVVKNLRKFIYTRYMFSFGVEDVPVFYYHRLSIVDYEFKGIVYRWAKTKWGKEYQYDHYALGEDKGYTLLDSMDSTMKLDKLDTRMRALRVNEGYRQGARTIGCIGRDAHGEAMQIEFSEGYTGDLPEAMLVHISVGMVIQRFESNQEIQRIAKLEKRSKEAKWAIRKRSMEERLKRVILSH